MVVHKFGGSCFRDQSSLSVVLSRISPGDTVVVSAAYGVTDILLSFLSSPSEDRLPEVVGSVRSVYAGLGLGSHELFDDLWRLLEASCLGMFGDEERAHVLSYGERLMAVCLAGHMGVDVEWPEDFLVVSGPYEESDIDLGSCMMPAGGGVIPGFYGVGVDGSVHLLGRSGTDYTATAVGALLGSSVIIWKDVAGFMSADPHVVPTARSLSALTFDAVEELSYYGAKILHPRAIGPARAGGIKVEIRNLYRPDICTRVVERVNGQVVSLAIQHDAVVDDHGIEVRGTLMYLVGGDAYELLSRVVGRPGVRYCRASSGLLVVVEESRCGEIAEYLHNLALS